MDDHDIYERSATLRTSLRLGLRRARVVTGCSAFVLEDARERFGLDMAKARVIFNGVDLDETSPVAVPLPFERYALGLGRVVQKKGFDLLLDAFAIISASYPDVGLVIAGDGAERDALMRQARALGLAERVAMPGRLSRNEVAAVMQRAEIFVMPSRVEPFGIVVLEGWRAGIPVLVTSRGGASEFVADGVSGLVVDPFSTKDFAAALGSLLSSAALRSCLVDGGREALARFEWSTLARSYEAVYADTIGHRRALT